MQVTPLESLHKQLGAELGEYCGWQLPKFYSNLEAELLGTKEGCGAFDFSHFGRINVKGSDAESLINALLATKTHSLVAGKCIDGFCCNDKGDIVDFLRVLANGNSYTIITQPVAREAVLDLIQKCKSEFSLAKVDVVDQTDKTAMVGICGPKAFGALSNILPLDISGIEPDSVEKFNFFMMNITVLRSNWLGIESIELICPSSAAKFAGGAIEKYHEREGITPAGMEALKSLILEKYPFENISGTSSKEIKPADAGLEKLLDMDKEFYGKPAIV